MIKYLVIDLDNTQYYPWHSVIKECTINNTYFIFVSSCTLRKDYKKALLNEIDNSSNMLYATALPGKESADMLCAFIAGTVHALNSDAKITFVSDDVSFKSLERNIKAYGVKSSILSVPSTCDKKSKIETLHKMLVDLGLHPKKQSNNTYSNIIKFIKNCKLVSDNVLDVKDEQQSQLTVAPFELQNEIAIDTSIPYLKSKIDTFSSRSECIVLIENESINELNEVLCDI